MAESQSKLWEQDPELEAVLDKQSRRNLLEGTAPLVVDTETGKPLRIILEIRNGPKGLIDLAINSDEAWLQPETTRMTLVGGESGDCVLSVTPEGHTEYANLVLAWEGIEQTLGTSVMVVRKVSDEPTRPGPGDSEPGERKPKKKPISEAVLALERFIDGCGGPDKFIDKDEEDRIFRKGGSLELTNTETESVLNRSWCRRRLDTTVPTQRETDGHAQ